MIHIIVFMILIITYISLFHYPATTLFTSLLVVSCIYSFVIWIIIALTFLFNISSKTLQIIASILLSVTSYSILLTFILDFIGNSNWGTNVTFNFILKYAQQLPKLEATLPVSLNTIYLLLLTSFLILFFIYLKSIKIILLSLNKLTNKVRTRTTSKREMVYSLFSFFIIPFFILAYQSSQSNSVNDLWDGEPLTDLLLPHVSITLNKTPIYSPSPYTTNLDITDKPNVIIIIADALRADHLGTYGYKRKTSGFIDSLISTKKAIKIENAFSTCSESNCGILSTLSSMPFDKINTKNTKINNILKQQGYDINFILSADHTWAGLKEHYPPYDLFYDGNDTEKYTITDDRLVLEKLSTISNFKKPSFFYFHLMSNHPASTRKKSYSKFFPTKSPNDWFYNLPIIKNIFSVNKILLETNFYDNGILETDYYISQIFKQLTEKGYMQDSIVWIIADHGEAIGEHGHFGHIGNLYNEEIQIPMIIVDSKLDLYKEKNFATQLDVAPTILDRLDIDIPSNWEGHSLLKKKEGTIVTQHNVPDREGNKALIMKTDDNQIYKMLYNEKPLNIQGIFNLIADKHEKRNLNNSDNKDIIDELINHLKLKNSTTMD